MLQDTLHGELSRERAELRKEINGALKGVTARADAVEKGLEHHGNRTLQAVETLTAVQAEQRINDTAAWGQRLAALESKVRDIQSVFLGMRSGGWKGSALLCTSRNHDTRPDPHGKGGPFKGRPQQQRRRSTPHQHSRHPSEGDATTYQIVRAQALLAKPCPSWHRKQPGGSPRSSPNVDHCNSRLSWSRARKQEGPNTPNVRGDSSDSGGENGQKGSVSWPAHRRRRFHAAFDPA